MIHKPTTDTIADDEFEITSTFESGQRIEPD